jgi:hypothetical protein
VSRYGAGQRFRHVRSNAQRLRLLSSVAVSLACRPLTTSRDAVFAQLCWKPGAWETELADELAGSFSRGLPEELWRELTDAFPRWRKWFERQR